MLAWKDKEGSAGMLMAKAALGEDDPGISRLSRHFLEAHSSYGLFPVWVQVYFRLQFEAVHAKLAVGRLCTWTAINGVVCTAEMTA